jgi:Xaa-Pro aminopeptidase
MLQGPFGEFSDEILSGSNDLTLESDMIINVEVNHFEFGVGGLKSEVTVLVTPTGWQLITPQERMIYVVA